MDEAYTLTQADVDGCRQVLAELEEIEDQLGAFSVGSVQGHMQSATATVRYERASDPFTTAAAINRALNSLPMVSLLAKKIVTHAETHPGEVRSG